MSRLLQVGPADDVLVPDISTLKTRASVPGAIEAEQLVLQERYNEAAALFRQVATRCQSKGERQLAIAYDISARRFETRIQLFQHKPVSSQNHPPRRRLEPRSGVYLGAFIDREDRVLETFPGVGPQIHRKGDVFNQQIGKRHATFLTYSRYGLAFPEAWFAHLKELGAAAQWAWEPESLDLVRDDDYLRGMARAIAKTEVPVFLRFASEMNGKWTRYSGNPAAYRSAFQTVAKVFHEEAPHVALVWCPNENPRDKIAEYYPGEEATDWVGVNFYNVLYNNNDPRKPVEWRHPADCLDYIYQTYSPRHPILIGEYAATHRSSADSADCPEFTCDKIGQLFSSLPRLYPRLKATHWFSMNAMRWAPSGRQLNNYALLDHPKVAQRYKELVASPYFLEQVRPDGEVQAPEEVIALGESMELTGVVTLSVWVKSYVNRPSVIVSVAGKERARFLQPGHQVFTLDTRTLPIGPTVLTVEVRAPGGRLAGRKQLKIAVRRGNAV
jgi:Glycosyl hydrolase family 26